MIKTLKMIQALLCHFISIVTVLQYAYAKKADNISLEKVFEWNELKFNTKFNIDNTIISQTIMPSTIRFNTRGQLFISIPRDTKESQKIPSTFNLIEVDGLLKPWPDEDTNNYNSGRFKSIVGFEIDLHNNIWLLNHNNTRCELLHYSSSGVLIHSYSFQETTNATSYLTMINLDTKNKFAFISDAQSRDLNNPNNLKNYGLILLNIKKEVSWKILGRTIDVDKDLNSSYYDVNLNAISLRCDERYLFFSAFLSDKLNAIRTTPLRKNQSIEESTTFNYTKHVISEDMLSSARGHFYYTHQEEQEIHEQFYEKDFLFDNIRHIGWFHSEDKLKRQGLLPKSIAFNGVSGYLYVLMSRFNRNLKNNPKFDSSQINYGIYKANVNDRSYLYECNIEEDVSGSSWFVVTILSFVFSISIIYFVNFLTSTTSQSKINNKLKGTEEDGILLMEVI